MNRHAFLIMTHGNWNILDKLIQLLTDDRNDIFVHIDARQRAHIPSFVLEYAQRGVINLIDPIKVYWADYSQVEAILKLLKEAFSNGRYSYYHLLSGCDLPIKSKEAIYYFFENSGKNFIGIVPREVYYSVRRVKYYHFLVHNRYYRNLKVLKILDRMMELVQRIAGVNRLKGTDYKIVDGWGLFSIRNELCEYVISNESLIRKMFRCSIAADELFLQTLVYNSQMYSTLFDTSDLKNGSMRYIDWERGKPYIWGNDPDDFRMLIESPYMFARKFDEKQMWIVDEIFERLYR